MATHSATLVQLAVHALTSLHTLDNFCNGYKRHFAFSANSSGPSVGEALSDTQSGHQPCLHDASEAIPVSMLPVHRFSSVPYGDLYNRGFH